MWNHFSFRSEEGDERCGPRNDCWHQELGRQHRIIQLHWTQHPPALNRQVQHKPTAAEANGYWRRQRQRANAILRHWRFQVKCTGDEGEQLPVGQELWKREPAVCTLCTAAHKRYSTSAFAWTSISSSSLPTASPKPFWVGACVWNRAWRVSLKKIYIQNKISHTSWLWGGVLLPANVCCLLHGSVFLVLGMVETWKICRFSINIALDAINSYSKDSRKNYQKLNSSPQYLWEFAIFFQIPTICLQRIHKNPHSERTTTIFSQYNAALEIFI